MEIEFDCVPPALPGIDILLVHSQKKAKRIIGKIAGEKAVKDCLVFEPATLPHRAYSTM